MNGRLVRELPTYPCFASSSVSEGQIVKFNGGLSGSVPLVTPVTADTDAVAGVVLETADQNTVVNVALRGSGMPLEIKLGSPASAGAALYITGSTGYAVTASSVSALVISQSNTLSSTVPVYPAIGYTLESGLTGDLVKAFIV